MVGQELGLAGRLSARYANSGTFNLVVMCQMGSQRLGADTPRIAEVWAVSPVKGLRLRSIARPKAAGARPATGHVKLGGNMSVSEDRTAQPSVQPAAPASGIADPAPLGLAAFALTTFLLSAANANWMTAATTSAWLGYAFAYGGIIQLLAGMWEFRNRNVFGATAFSTYGAFWIGLFFWARFVSPAAPASSAFALRDQAWIFLAFLIFNTYMLILSAQLNMTIFAVFLTLELTEFFGFIGLFASLGLLQFAGYVGIITAFTAWYASFAIMSNDMGGRIKLPVGKPLI